LPPLGRRRLGSHRLPCFPQRQAGLPQQPFHPLVPPLLALPLDQLQQVLLVTQRLLLGLPGQLLVAGPECRQVQLLQARQQQLLQLVRVHRHVQPPCSPVRRHTTPDPRQPPPPP